MPQLKEQYYTSADYWHLPEGARAELIKGQLYAMAAPSYRHQMIIGEMFAAIRQYIKDHKGDCRVIVAPFAVNLKADDSIILEPDIMVVCDKEKLTERECKGAPDFVAEVVSPGSRKMDYSIKNGYYAETGVREYWIIDPERECTTVYRYEEDAAPIIIPFAQAIELGIYKDLSITIADFV